MSGGFVDLTADDSEDDHGLLADGRDDDFEFVEDKTPKPAPRGQARQGLAQIVQSDQRKRNRRESKTEQPNKLVPGMVGGQFVLTTTLSPYCCFIVMINDVTASVLTASACVVLSTSYRRWVPQLPARRL